jgi:hypothetical protein
MVVGRYVCLALRYRPQALHIVSPLGARRQRGVVVVPQLEHCVAETWLFILTKSDELFVEVEAGAAEVG